MHNPATGSQMAKDFGTLCKSAQPSKPRDIHLATQLPALPPCHNCDSHSSYHTNHQKRHAKQSCSCSCSCNCSRSCDHHDDYCRSQHSSCPCHDNYIGHHDVHPSNKPHLDISDYQPVSFTSVASFVSLHSSNIVFDSDLNNIEHVKKFATYPNYDNEDNSHSYIGKTPSKPDNTFCVSTFNIHNYTDPKTKQYNYWYHTKLYVLPPAGLMDLCVAN